MAAAVGVGGAGGGGASAALGDGGAIDYSVHEAWNEATNVYLLVVLASLALLVYARRNKRRIMRIFTLPPAAETPPETNFYDSVKKIRLRQQLEMYSIVGTPPVLWHHGSRGSAAARAARLVREEVRSEGAAV
ncbi:small integral membrane protein 19 isoform X2 [Catharus ustulatus]|uniref:small integral membrane protein 19 isoform X2 n=1 Tax=Catharus ustulatus TaxID=91951 RepID=UPI0014081DBF|nr:small integral membrane protein 19 isoform X2 [Catharus ustulatus]